MLEGGGLKLKCLGIACSLLNSPSFRCPNAHIQLMLDNTTATIYINKMVGTHSLICNDIAKSIWQWATHRNIWLSAAYVPGSDNTVADFKSQHFVDNTEWNLSPVLFQKLTQQFSIPRVDLFASRLNHQVDTFGSWKLQPQAWVVNAFSLNWKDIMLYAFPPINVWVKFSPKSKRNRLLAFWYWAYPSMVPCYAGSLGGSSSASQAQSKQPVDQGESTATTSSSYKSVSFSDSFIRSTLGNTGLSQGSTELLSHAWREGTTRQYDSTVWQWGAYCRKWKIDPLAPPIAAVVIFLTSLFEMGLGYGGVASARSALGNFITVHGFPKLADHPLMQKLLKGVANGRPPQPRYMRIWDTTLLIKYLDSPTNEVLDFQHLCWKPSALLTILSGQQVSTIHKFQLNNLQLTDTIALFNITVPLTQSKPSRNHQPVIFHQYLHNEQLCLVRHVQVYLEQRKSLSVMTPYDAFFLTHRRPHHSASKATIARWVKTVLHLSGVNIDIYKPHSLLCFSRR